MEFDDVLQQVGEFGRYQKRLLLLICVTGGTVIVFNLSPVFTMNIPSHRCRLPGYPNDTYEIQDTYHERLVNHTIPLTEDGEYSQCTVYEGSADAHGTPTNATERYCNGWVYDKTVFTETVSSQLNLVCGNKMYRSHSSMLIFAGKFVGAFLSSVCGDHFGRRRVYTVMMLAMLGSLVGTVFVSSLPALLALRFLAGGTTTGSYLCTYVIGMELMGKSQRRFISLSFKSCEIVFTLTATLFAFLLRHWSHFQATLLAPCLLVLAGYFFIPESPRWLMSKGRVKEAQDIVDNIARINGAWPSPSLQDTRENCAPVSAGKTVVVSPVALFQVPRLSLRYAALYVCWILIVMTQYGLMLNVSNMSGNIFLNFALMAGVDLLALLIYILFIERVGRRPLLVSMSGLAGLACLATILPTVLGGSNWILRGLSIAGKLGTSTAFMTIYVMSPELFPTVLRSFGLGSCSMMARLGGLASPYVADLNTYVSGGVWGPALPQIVFGVAGVLTSGLVLLVLPETRGQRLPETVEDSVTYNRQKHEKKDHEMSLIKVSQEQDDDFHNEQCKAGRVEEKVIA